MSRGRKPLTVGTYGEIGTKQQENGSWRASARFRDRDGETRTVSRRGPTKAAATRVLKAHFVDRQTPTSGDISPDMRLTKLLRLWVEQARFQATIAPQTLEKYEGVINAQIVPRIGGLAIREVNVPILDEQLKAIGKTQLTNARHFKIVMKQVMQLAVSHGAIPTNPVRDTSPLPKSTKEVLAIELDEVSKVRTAIQALAGANRMGPKRNVENLSDVVELMFATGARVNEVLAIRWEDIDFETSTVTIHGTLIRIKGQGIRRQPWTKSDAGFRAIVLPGFGMNVLRRRLEIQPPNELDAAMSTATGSWMSANNLRTQWRTARKEAKLDWIDFHTIRKTVATILEREVSLKDAAAQLGHASERTTEASYVKKAAKAPNNSATLEKLSPDYDPGAD